MRTLSDTLLAAQQVTSIDALVKLVLTFGESSYTYTRTRILDITETEDGELQSLEITLDNSDKALNDLSFKGYKSVFSSGAVTGEGDEYSACAPMWVIDQRFDSVPDELTCTLSLIGIFNRMAQDKAALPYEYNEDHSYIVKELITQVLETGWGAGACFTICTNYYAVWEDGYDELADTYTPNEAFRVSPGANRKSIFDRLMAYTQNVARVEADGYVHIFKPTTSGETYDYEYSLESGHTFFAKAYRDKLVIPNRFYVRNWPRYGPPYYDGEAIDSDSYDKLPMTRYLLSVNVESDEQAQGIAEAKLAIAQMWCEAGSAPVPNNVGQEVYDYINVTDERADDSRVGNIGQIIRHINLMKNEWRMTFVLGNWQNVRKALDKLGITESDLETYFEELIVDSLLANNIFAASGDFAWWDMERGVGVDGIRGASIYGSAGVMALRTYPTDDDFFDDTNLQCYVGTDGIIGVAPFDGAYKVQIDENGVTLNESALLLYTAGGETQVGYVSSGTYLYVKATGGYSLSLEAESTGNIYLNPGGNYVLPTVTNDIRLGSADAQFYGGYFASRLKIPVGEDMYD